jgi:hypothetical protein
MIEFELAVIAGRSAGFATAVTPELEGLASKAYFEAQADLLTVLMTGRN